MEDHIKLFPSLANARSESSNDITTIPSFSVVEEKSHFLINMIVNIPLKSDDEITSFIQRYHTSFLNYQLFIDSDISRSAMQRLFTNIKFLTLFFNHIGSLNLNYIEIAFLNRIIYDYWTIQDKDEDVCNILLQISSYINSNMIIKLSSKIGVNEARLLAMISSSSIDPHVRVHRINRFFVNCTNPVLDCQSMIDMMFFLYDSFLYPIVYTLLEDESCCTTEENMPQYNTLIKAIISILLSTTTEKMVTILTEYGYIISSGKAIATLRLKDINDDRLKAAIEKVEENPLIKEIP